MTEDLRRIQQLQEFLGIVKPPAEAHRSFAGAVTTKTKLVNEVINTSMGTLRMVPSFAKIQESYGNVEAKEMLKPFLVITILNADLALFDLHTALKWVNIRHEIRLADIIGVDVSKKHGAMRIAIKGKPSLDTGIRVGRNKDIPVIDFKNLVIIAKQDELNKEWTTAIDKVTTYTKRVDSVCTVAIDQAIKATVAGQSVFDANSLRLTAAPESMEEEDSNCDGHINSFAARLASLQMDRSVGGGRGGGGERDTRWAEAEMVSTVVAVMVAFVAQSVAGKEAQMSEAVTELVSQASAAGSLPEAARHRRGLGSRTPVATISLQLSRHPIWMP